MRQALRDAKSRRETFPSVARRLQYFSRMLRFEVSRIMTRTHQQKYVDEQTRENADATRRLFRQAERLATHRNLSPEKQEAFADVRERHVQVLRYLDGRQPAALFKTLNAQALKPRRGKQCSQTCSPSKT